MTATEIPVDGSALIERAQARAVLLGRWDAEHAILDLIAEEIPAEHRAAAALYLATETAENLWAAWDVLGGRSEYSGWVFDVLSDLGTWVMIGSKPALSPYCPRWTPPTPPRRRADETPRVPEPHELAINEVTRCPDGHCSVKVYRELGEIPDDMRWWMAVEAGLLELEFIYYVPEIDGFADQRHVQAIHKLHPDRSLVYL